MSDSAQKVLQYADHSQQKLHQTIADEASKIVGRQIKPADVNPDDQSPLREIQDVLGDSTHVAGSTVEELLHGSSTAHVRTVKGKRAVSISAGKWFKKKFLNKVD